MRDSLGSRHFRVLELWIFLPVDYFWVFDRIWNPHLVFCSLSREVIPFFFSQCVSFWRNPISNICFWIVVFDTKVMFFYLNCDNIGYWWSSLHRKSLTCCTRDKFTRSSHAYRDYCILRIWSVESDWRQNRFWSPMHRGFESIKTQFSLSRNINVHSPWAKHLVLHFLWIS